MWPVLLDMTRDECKRVLRRLELEAYASTVSSFRAQGDLTKEKKRILQDLQNILRFPILFMCKLTTIGNIILFKVCWGWSPGFNPFTKNIYEGCLTSFNLHN